MKSLTLKQFRYFEALAQTGHFGRAAEVCSISQPALSMQIKELELVLGVALFTRNVRRLQLTPFGEEFALRVRGIIQTIDEIGDLARLSQSGVLNRFRLGIIPTIAPYLLPSIIGSLTQRFSNMDIDVRETLTQNLIQEVADGKIDAAIVALPISEPELVETVLFEEDFVLIRHKEDAQKPVPDGDTLRKMRLLLLEEGHCFRDQALSFCNVKSGLPRDGLDGSSLSTLVQMVGAGIGVTLIPQMAVDVETRSANVSVSQFNRPKPTRTIGMIWRKKSALSKQLIEISDLVKHCGLKFYKNTRSTNQ